MSAPALKGDLVLAGAGKMGGAMLEGWLDQGLPPEKIIILDPAPPPTTQALIDKYGLRQNSDLDGLSDVALVVIAVKPQLMPDVLPKLSPLKSLEPLILSVAAGTTIATFESHFGSSAAVIRSIPNTPAAIGRGITAFTANGNVNPEQRQLASTLLSAVGEVVEVDDEDLIDAVTAVSGSGPAYVFYLTECLTMAAQAVGLPAGTAAKLARATVSGSGELMRVSGEDAAQLRENVTSPNGTTHAALQVLMADDGLKPLMIQAVKAAQERSRELAAP